MSLKRLGGRYEIQNRVGGGGMAVVYRGHDLLLDRTVAIKVLRSQYGTDEEFIRRFRREAQSAARLSHPNVVSIYDVGQEEDVHYIVMEYVEGETLKDLIKREAPLDAKKAVEIAVQIAEALDHAHQNQIIHRDIKPQNILISKYGRVKVTDFGIARAVSSATITHTGSVMGSVHYFSPEQAKGGITGEKSDIYSLGVVIYEMVTGFLPFSGESPISVALKHLQGTFRPPRDINPSIPQSLENIILKSLCKDPDRRYHTVRQLIQDLQTCLNPERLNEPRYSPDADDDGEDPTIIIPALHGYGGKEGKDDDDYGDDERDDFDVDGYEEDGDWEGEEPGRKKWVKPAVWFSVIAISVLLVFAGVSKIAAMLENPDISVPYLVGKQVDEATSELKEKGLLYQVEERFDDTVPLGYVIRQEPAPGTSVKKNAVITLVVSKGKEKIAMPVLIGKTRGEAEADLLPYHFEQVNFKEEFSDKVPAGQVIRQEPEGNTMVVPEETIVTVYISKGKGSFEMPSLIGKDEASAKSILLRHGLKYNEQKTRYVESYFDEGIVVSQWPVQPGEKVSAGQEITLEVSKGMKADAVRVTEPVMVVTDSPVKVTIYVSDARFNQYPVIQETVSSSREFEISLVLSPRNDGRIDVYKNGVFDYSKPIRYEEVAEVGGD